MHPQINYTNQMTNQVATTGTIVTHNEKLHQNNLIEQLEN